MLREHAKRVDIRFPRIFPVKAVIGFAVNDVGWTEERGDGLSFFVPAGFRDEGRGSALEKVRGVFLEVVKGALREKGDWVGGLECWDLAKREWDRIDGEGSFAHKVDRVIFPSATLPSTTLTDDEETVCLAEKALERLPSQGIEWMEDENHDLQYRCAQNVLQKGAHLTRPSPIDKPSVPPGSLRHERITRTAGDSRLTYLETKIDGYFLLGDQVWDDVPEVARGGICPPGGMRNGKSIAISEDASADSEGYYPCVVLQIRTDWRNRFPSDVDQVFDEEEVDDMSETYPTYEGSEKEIVPGEPINVPLLSQNGLTLVNNPRRAGEISVRGKMPSHEVLRQITNFVADFGVRLVVC